MVAVEEHFANRPFAPRQRAAFGDAIAPGAMALPPPAVDDDGAHFAKAPLALRHWVFGIGDGAAETAAGRAVAAASAASVRMRRFTRSS